MHDSTETTRRTCGLDSLAFTRCPDRPNSGHTVYCLLFARHPEDRKGKRPAIDNGYSNPRHLDVIDSHTAGEPTRVVLPTGYAPDLGSGTLAERFERLRTEFDHLRRAILCEPRGSEVLVGAWLLAPDTSDCAAAVIFFNNAGYLGMCGHGTIGVAVTLAHIGRIGLGEHRIQTPVGIVPFELHSPHEVTIRNVPAYRHRKALNVDVPGYGAVTGDVAWGGNWFFLVGHHGRKLEKATVDELTAFTRAIRNALGAQGVTGADGAEIDHIELYSDVVDSGVKSWNFVLCPGGEYDRSPCGTGTSAHLACLAADGKLEPGQKLLQEGILGTAFEGRYEIAGDASAGRILPRITGSAYITAKSTLIYEQYDPFLSGVPA
jgi:4-hydroxyproline epimerase